MADNKAAIVASSDPTGLTLVRTRRDAAAVDRQLTFFAAA
jgi:hypothetical protein